MRALLFILTAISAFAQTAVSATKSQSQPDPAWEDLSFSVEDSRCFVGLAPVYLTVSELVPRDGKLIGYYEIKVPLMTSKNDRGKIILPLDASVRELGDNGGILEGEAHSKLEEGIVNRIVCEILPEKNQTIKLAITTKDRTVKFKSRYTVIERSETQTDT